MICYCCNNIKVLVCTYLARCERRNDASYNLRLVRIGPPHHLFIHLGLMHVNCLTEVILGHNCVRDLDYVRLVPLCHAGGQVHTSSASPFSSISPFQTTLTDSTRYSESLVSTTTATTFKTRSNNLKNKENMNMHLSRLY